MSQVQSVPAQARVQDWPAPRRRIWTGYAVPPVPATVAGSWTVPRTKGSGETRVTVRLLRTVALAIGNVAL